MMKSRSKRKGKKKSKKTKSIGRVGNVSDKGRIPLEGEREREKVKNMRGERDVRGC